MRLTDQGEDLRTLLNRRGITITSIERRCGWGRERLRRYVNGDRNILHLHVGAAIALAHTLGMSLEGTVSALMASHRQIREERERRRLVAELLDRER